MISSRSCRSFSYRTRAPRALPFCVALTAALAALPAVASAQEVPPAPPATPEAPAPTSHGPRLRAGVGGWAAMGVLPVPGHGIAGVSLRFGVQFNDTVALFGQVQGAVGLLGALGTANVMVDFTAADVFTAGFGFGAVSGHQGSLFNGSRNGGAIGVPVRMALNVGGVRRANGVRQRISISLDGFLGLSTGQVAPSGTLGGYAGFGLGYEVM